MSQRPSGYVRRPDEDYATVEWPVLALLTALRLAPMGKIWDPCNGAGKLVATLRAHGFDAIGTSTDFFTITSVPAGVSDLITNPPYSAITRQHLFRHCEYFAGKVVLLNRIKWFEGPSSPSDNHSWFFWSCGHVGPPTITYVTRAEATS